ncbi:MAG: type II secretion system protein [Candidatus Taylorbacteria bacterium]
MLKSFKKKSLPNSPTLHVTRYTLHSSRGFSLIELAVTITIFVVLTTAVLIKNSRFQSDLIITNLAYEIALTIRQAQTYGINVKAYDSTSFNYAYGVHFDVGTSAAKEKFQLFVDLDDSNVYTEDPLEEVSAFQLKAKNVISDLCVYQVSSGGVGDCTIDFVDITFKRPEPEALICIGTDSCEAKRAVIEVTSPKGVKRTVEVKSTGQISVLMPN